MSTYFFVLIAAILMFTAKAVYGKGCEPLQELPWSYEGENGPDSWGSTYPDCKGKEQSPLQFISHNIDKTLHELDLNNYDQPISQAKVENTGYTIKVTPNDGVDRTITLRGKVYSMKEFVFHWGDKNVRGAEHIRFFNQSALEVQFSHTSEDDETCIFAVYFKEGNDTADNEELQNFVDVLPNVQYKGDESDLSSDLNLSNMFSTDTTDYLIYNGSLTTPPCTEGVKWVVELDAVPLGTEQMKQFRQLYAVKKEDASDDCRLINNFRPVQPQNGRFIFSPEFVLPTKN